MTDIPTKPLLPYKITICGLNELDAYCAAQVSHVLSILDPGHPDTVSFRRYGPHQRLIWRFHDIIAPRQGQNAPSADTVQSILDFGASAEGAEISHLLIHCHAGISRSTATAVILMVQNNPGREAEAFERLFEVRPRSWPNSLMIHLADRMLDRDGALIEAMRGHHHRVAQIYPDFARALRGGERAHELPKGSF